MTVADRLHSAAIHLLRAVRGADMQGGMTAPRLSVLSVLVYGGDRTIGELARAEQVRPPSMTRLIDGLERDGFVGRKADRYDGRIARVGVTARGRSALKAARERRLAALEALLRSRPPAELALLDRAAALIERLTASDS
jgi:DNA-binding MarR family transcriptional regulator